jgi:hypothetical protein
MRDPVVAYCPGCERNGVVVCRADGKCADCALHDDCDKSPDETVHGEPGGPVWQSRASER